LRTNQPGEKGSPISSGNSGKGASSGVEGGERGALSFWEIAPGRKLPKKKKRREMTRHNNEERGYLHFQVGATRKQKRKDTCPEKKKKGIKAGSGRRLEFSRSEAEEGGSSLRGEKKELKKDIPKKNPQIGARVSLGEKNLAKKKGTGPSHGGKKNTRELGNGPQKKDVI